MSIKDEFIKLILQIRYIKVRSRLLILTENLFNGVKKFEDVIINV